MAMALSNVFKKVKYADDDGALCHVLKGRRSIRLLISKTLLLAS